MLETVETEKCVKRLRRETGDQVVGVAAMMRSTRPAAACAAAASISMPSSQRSPREILGRSSA